MRSEDKENVVVSFFRGNHSVHSVVHPFLFYYIKPVDKYVYELSNRGAFQCGCSDGAIVVEGTGGRMGKLC